MKMVGNIIKTRRVKMGFSQKRLAYILGNLTPQFISHVESGRSPFPKSKLRRLSKTLMIDRQVLLQAIMADELIKYSKLLNIDLNK